MRAIMCMLAPSQGLESSTKAASSFVAIYPHCAAEGIVYCPEARGIFSSLNVWENLMLPEVPGRFRSRTLRWFFQKSCRRLDQPGHELSGGGAIRAGDLATAHRSQLLRLDEPTECLAPVLVQHIRPVPSACCPSAGLHDLW